SRPWGTLARAPPPRGGSATWTRTGRAEAQGRNHGPCPRNRRSRSRDRRNESSLRFYWPPGHLANRPFFTDHSPMIISRTPLRVSLFGGGTDYPHWYRRHGGATLVTTI